MGLKQVKSDAFDQLLVLVDAKPSTCAILVANNKMGLKQVKSDDFDVLLRLVHIKRCTCATLVPNNKMGLKKLKLKLLTNFCC